MTHVVIRRCTVNVVRHGGWSWGSQPRFLVDGVLAALPALLAAELTDLPEMAGKGTVEITTPLRVTVPLRLEDLAGWATAAPHPGVVPRAPVATTVRASVRRAITAAVAATPSQAKTAPEPSPNGHPAPAAIPDGASALVSVLLAARRRGDVASLLALLPPAAVVRWYALLSAMTPPAAHAIPAPVVTRVVTAHAQRQLSLHHDGVAVRCRRIAAMTDLLAAHGIAPGHPAVGASLDKHLPLPEPGAPEPVAAGDDRERADAGTVRVTTPTLAAPGAGSTRRAAPTSRGLQQAADVSALPFLLLDPLARLGYLEAAAAVFAAAEASDRLPALAAAIAWKVMPSPERGWRRTPADRRSAMVFASVAEPVLDTEIAAMARDADLIVSPATAALVHARVSGRPTTEPVIVHEPASGGVLVADAHDLGPLAWVADATSAADLLARCGAPPAFVGPGGAEPAVFRALEGNGVPFATDVRPVRGERWSRVAGSENCWGAGAAGDMATASTMSARAALFAEVIDDLVSRPAFPLGTDRALERALTVTGGAALARLASQLWGDAEQTDPLLALERLGDLTARVRFEPDRVLVLLPMGRRRADLSANGLLGDVVDVPWLGGRVVEFGGG